MTPEEFYEQQRLLGLTTDITENPEPDYNQPFYQSIFRLMESYTAQQKEQWQREAFEAGWKYCESYFDWKRIITNGRRTTND